MKKMKGKFKYVKPWGSSRRSGFGYIADKTLSNPQDVLKEITVHVPINHKKHWSNESLSELKRLLKKKVPLDIISLKLGRTIEAIKAKVKRLNL